MSSACGLLLPGGHGKLHVVAGQIAWPASLGWLSGPAGATLEGSLAGFACLAQGESRAQPMPHGQTTLPAALSGLDGPSGTTARLSHFCWTASSVISQTQAVTHSSFAHRPLERGQAVLGRWSPNTI